MGLLTKQYEIIFFICTPIYDCFIAFKNRNILQFSTLSISQDMIKSLVLMKNKENCLQKVNLWLKMTQKAYKIILS